MDVNETENQNSWNKERTHPFAYHNRLRVEISVTFSPFWIASWELFVGTAGIYACTAADNHRMQKRIVEAVVEECGVIVGRAEMGQPSLGLRYA